jgi:hypothetical protein
MRPELLELISRNERAAKLVHLRSPAVIARWLAEVRAGADRAAGLAR